MRLTATILCLLLWFGYTNKYCLRPVSAGITYRTYPMRDYERVEFIERSKGNSLWMILYLNQQMKGGAIEPGRVYGVWLEDMRVYCDFPLVGNIYGWGSLYNVAGCDTPADLREYLESVGCEYIIWDGACAKFIKPYMELHVLSQRHLMEWGCLFEPVEIDPALSAAGCEVWKCR